LSKQYHLLLPRSAFSQLSRTVTRRTIWIPTSVTPIILIHLCKWTAIGKGTDGTQNGREEEEDEKMDGEKMDGGRQATIGLPVDRIALDHAQNRKILHSDAGISELIDISTLLQAN
jgi:hypothetical protein